MIEENTQDNESTFAELLDEYEPHPAQPGEYRPGEILQIDEEYTIIDIGAKQEALVPTQELDQIRADSLETLSVGDRVPVYVDSLPTLGDRLMVSVQKGMEQEDWEKAEKLLETQENLELEITGYNKGGILVKFHQLTGFVPNSHISELRRTHEDQTIKSKMVGQTIPVQVLQVEPARKRLVFSARAAAKIRREKCLEALEAGQTVEGVVKNLVSFGAFVDLGGVDGLIHISELDWKHIEHPSEVLQTGDTVQVIVRDVDRERERISLSRKALLPSPWQQFADMHEVGSLIEGEITNVQDYGAFVQLTDDIAGLLHISEVDVVGDSGSPHEMFRKGDKILTRIIEVDPEEERIRLSTRRVTYEELAAWATKDWKKDPEENSQDEGATPAAEETDASTPEMEIQVEEETEETPTAAEEPAASPVVESDPEPKEEMEKAGVEAERILL